MKNSTQQRPHSSLFAPPTTTANFLDFSMYPKETSTLTPELPPRQINFSIVTAETPASRHTHENLLGTPAIVEEVTDDENPLSDIQEDQEHAEEVEELRKSAQKLPGLENEVEKLRIQLEQVTNDLRGQCEESGLLTAEKKELQNEVNQLKMQVIELQKLEIELRYKMKEIEEVNGKLKEVQAELESRNQEIAVLQDKSDAKAAECETLQIEIERLRKSDCTSRLMFQVDTLNQQIESMNKIISHKDELINKLEKDALNYSTKSNENQNSSASIEREVIALREEMTETKQKLTEKLISLEKLKLSYEELERQNTLLKTNLQQKDELIETEHTDEVYEKLRDEQNKNLQLMNELDRLRAIFSETDANELQLHSENMDSRLRELKQLLDQEMQKSQALMQIRDELQADFNELKRQYDIEKDNGLKLHMILESERKQSNSIQNQDANLIQVLRIRLNAALENEATLQDALEKEKTRNEHLAGVQRTKSFDNYIMMRSPIDSPKKFHRSSDFESEAMVRYESEIKLLTSQKDREKERVIDMQHVLERERERFEKDITERNEYLENLKREINRINRDKEILENDLENAQEKLLLQQREIENLELQINQLQQMDSRRAVRRGKEIVESSKTATDLHEVKERLRDVEKERDSLTEVIAQLRQDIEKSAKREAKLAESQTNLDGFVPEKLMEQFREMNRVLAQHAKENHQLVETMQIMSEERRELQRRILELEEAGAAFQPRTDLEERANHLFGKYLRTESYRKALVHQKRYLLMTLAVYEETEQRALQIMGDKGGKGGAKGKKKPSFKGAVYVIIAIERMKYIVRRWQSGRRVATRAIFSQPIHAPR